MKLRVVSRIGLGFGIALLVSAAAMLLIVPGAGKIAAVQGTVGLLLSAAYFLLNREAFGRVFGGRGTLFYGVSAASAVFLLALLVAANYVATTKQVTWDVTKGGIHTLADATLDALRGLQEEVHVTAFYGSQDPEYPYVKDLLDRYQQRTDKLVVEYVDPERSPQRVQEKGVTQMGPRVFFAKGSTEARANEVSEEAFTNALVRVNRAAEQRIYFTVGHGEGDTDDSTSERGFGKISQRLAEEGLIVRPLRLTTDEIPEDAAAIVILGPRRAFLEPEIEALETWLEKGGRLFVGLEPGYEDPGLEGLLETQGFIFDQAMIVDPLSRLFGGGDAIPIVQSYGEHAITDRFNLQTIFPTVRPVVARGDVEPRPTIVALTNPSSWGETDWMGGEVQYNPHEKRGSLGVMAAVSRSGSEDEIRIVAAGDVDFVTNRFERQAGNADLFLNAINWLASQEERITIRPRHREASQLLLTAEEARFLNFFSLGGLPMLVLAVGLSVWLVRRSK